MAAAESPPPMMVRASDSASAASHRVGPLMRRASTQRRPSARSRRPVWTARITSANRSRVFGPISTPSNPQGICIHRHELAIFGILAKGPRPRRQPATAAVRPWPPLCREAAGQIQLVFVQQRSAHLISLGFDEGVGHAAADQQVVHLVQQVFDTPILSFTFAPPMIAVKGRSGDSSASPSTSSSRCSKSRPRPAGDGRSPRWRHGPGAPRRRRR